MEKINILAVEHSRFTLDLSVRAARLNITLETQDKKTAFKEIRQLLADNQITDFADLFRLLYDEVDGYGKGHVAECILIIARYELSDSQVVDKEINAMAMLIELLGVIK